MGQRQGPAQPQALASVNPATGEELARFDELDDTAVDRKLEAAARAARAARHLTVDERAARLAEAARLLETDKAALARTIVEEMGKPLRAAIAEIEKCARCCRHYAERAAAYLRDEPLPTSDDDGDAAAYVRWLPLGPVLAIMPWNFPFWQVFRFAAPALAAGNVALLKHASNVPRCALAIEDLLARAGFGDGAFQTLLIGARRVARVIADPRVAAVTLTGSERAGVEVARVAGEHLKKTVLELGGSDPFIVMPSADLAAAVRAAVTARVLNNGQSCIAAKRFFVHREIYFAFERNFAEAVGALKVGDPMDDDTDVGPLATAAVRDAVERQVLRTIDAGARLLVGGERLGRGRGFYYAPTVLADVPRGSPAAVEELFGPVAPLFEARDLDHAIALANATPYGLGSSVWTCDPVEERRFVDELEAGQTFVNAMVASDPSRPFGGVKRSGYGRELAAQGMREFLNAKTVVIRHRPVGHRVVGAE
jgi:succinate-semialdehyde dehydrogenase/glutarate-semialdehyde dehydrogenase